MADGRAWVLAAVMLSAGCGVDVARDPADAAPVALDLIVEALDAAPVAAPDAVRVATPDAAPVAAPVATPDATPDAAPVAAEADWAAPDATPDAAPVETPDAAPDAAPVETPDATPDAAPVATPDAAVVAPVPPPPAEPAVCPEVPALAPAPAPPDTRAVPAVCPAPARDLGPWHGRATHPTPAGAGDTSRIVETEAGPAVYWRVGDDHFISVADPATGRWGPDRLVATDAAAFNAVIAVCDGILVDLVDENDPDAFIHLHLARPGAETVSRTMGASDPEHFWNVTHRPSLTATGLEIGIRDAFESCSVILESEPLDAQTLASLEPRAWVRDPRTPKPPVPKTRLAGAQFDYAFHGLSDALGFEREGPALPPFAREIPLPAGGVGPSAWFGTALGPAGDVFVYDAGSPRDGHGRLLHLDTNGRRVTPDRLLSDVALRGVSLVSWPGGVALALSEDAGTTLVALDDPALVPDLEAPCMADALGRCGAGAFEADGEGWRCVPARPGDETCNAVDDDCDGLTDEAPAGCDFRWAGPAVSPRPPLSCPMDLIPWPEPLWATDPNPDPCAAFVNERPCRVGDASFHYDAAGHLLREPHRSFVWEEDRLTGWEGVTLAYDAAGRLEAVDDGDFDRTAFTYDASGRLVSWETGGRTLEYAWAPDGQSVTVRHMDFGSLPDFEVVATLAGGSSRRSPACCPTRAAYRRQATPGAARARPSPPTTPTSRPATSCACTGGARP